MGFFDEVDALTPAAPAAAHPVGNGSGTGFFDAVDAAPPQDVSATPDGQQLAKELRAKADKMLLEHAGGAAASPAYAGLASAANTALLNAPRNIAAGLRTLRPGAGTFEQEYGYLRDIDEAAARQSPIAAGAGTVAGAVGQAAAIPLAPAASLAGRIGQGALYGAGASGVAEALDTKDLGEAGQAALRGGLLGAAATPIVEKVARGASRVAGAFGPKAVVPTKEELKAAGSAAYKAADEAGIIIRPEATAKLSNEVQGILAEKGYHPALQPKLRVAIEELGKLSEGNVTLKGMDVIRRIARSAVTDPDPSTSAFGKEFTSKIDDFLGDLKPADILAGDAKAAVKALSDARKNWSAYKKADVIDEAVKAAELRAATTGSGGNVENTLRQEFRKLLTNKKTARSFSPDEKAAILRVAKGSWARDLARLAGKVSPAGNGLSLMLHLGATAAAPGIALPAQAVGTAAKVGAERATYRAARRASELVRGGGQKTPLRELLSASDQQTLRNIMTSLGIQASDNLEEGE